MRRDVVRHRLREWKAVAPMKCDQCGWTIYDSSKAIIGHYSHNVTDHVNFVSFMSWADYMKEEQPVFCGSFCAQRFLADWIYQERKP